jgi:hypothetical protein
VLLNKLRTKKLVKDRKEEGLITTSVLQQKDAELIMVSVT